MKYEFVNTVIGNEARDNLILFKLNNEVACKISVEEESENVRLKLLSSKDEVISEVGFNVGSGATYNAGHGINIENNEISVDTNTIQEKLDAGENITIEGNVISATNSGTSGAVNYKGTFNSPIIATPEKGDYYVCSANELYLNGNMRDIHEDYAFKGKDYIVVDTGAKSIEEMNEYLASISYIIDPETGMGYSEIVHLDRNDGQGGFWSSSLIDAGKIPISEQENVYSLSVSKVTKLTDENTEVGSVCMYFSNAIDMGEGMNIPEEGWYTVNMETGTFTKIENNKIIIAIQKPTSNFDSQFTITPNKKFEDLDATVISATNHPILFKEGDWTVYNGSSWNLVIGHSIDNVIGDINTILDSINGEVI